MPLLGFVANSGSVMFRQGGKLHGISQGSLSNKRRLSLRWVKEGHNGLSAQIPIIFCWHRFFLMLLIRQSLSGVCLWVHFLEWCKIPDTYTVVLAQSGPTLFLYGTVWKSIVKVDVKHLRNLRKKQNNCIGNLIYVWWGKISIVFFFYIGGGAY